MRKEEETAAMEGTEFQMEDERDRLKIELEHEQRITLGMTNTWFDWCVALLICIYLFLQIISLILFQNKLIYLISSEVESWLKDRHKYLSNLHAEWTTRLRDEVAEKERELQALKDAREADRYDRVTTKLHLKCAAIFSQKVQCRLFKLSL